MEKESEAAARIIHTIAAAEKGGEGRTSPEKVILKFFQLSFSDTKNIAETDLTDAGFSALPGLGIITEIDDTAVPLISDVKMQRAAAMQSESSYRYDDKAEAYGLSFIAIGKTESSGFRFMINSHLKELVRIFSENLYYAVIHCSTATAKTSRCAAEEVRRYYRQSHMLLCDGFFEYGRSSCTGVYLG